MNGLLICIGISFVMFGASSVLVSFGLHEFFSNFNKKENIVRFDFTNDKK